MSGIATALAATTANLNLIVAVDIPLLTSEFIKYFADRACLSLRPLLACRLESGFPLCLAIHSDILAAVESYLNSGRRSIHGFVESIGAEILSDPELRSAGFSRDLFRNINTPEDYREIFAASRPAPRPSSSCH
jgi:molybdopterin-guanine dinucleotide biosynthesis protein A